MNTKTFTAAVALATLLAGSVVSAQEPAPSPSPTPNQIVYVPQLPAVADLAKGASAQGMTVSQITQSSDSITVVYKLANGQTNVVAYKPLNAAVAAGTVAMPSSPAPAYTSAPTSTTVVYTAPDYYGPGYYWPYYAPVSIGIGLGWGWHGGWGGGWRGGGGFHGGWR